MKKLFLILSLFFAMVLFAFPAVADEGTVLPPEYTEMLDALPDTLRDALPPDLYTTDPSALSRAIDTLLSPGELFGALITVLTREPQKYILLFLRLCGILLLRAVWNCLSANLKEGQLSSGLRVICRGVMALAILSQSTLLLDSVTAFYEDLFALTEAFLPLMGAMYAMGGNVSTALINESTLILSMGVTEWAGGKSIVPLFAACLSLSLLGVFDGSVAARMQIVTDKLKKWYATILSLVMLLLTAVLAAQNTLHAKADTLAYKAARFAVTSAIPIVGGSVSEMLRTAGAGLEWMRGIVGLGGILLLLWLLLPTLLSALLTRLVYSVAGGLAAFLGCEEEGKLLGEISKLHGILIAVLAVSVLTFFFALLLLLHCNVAYVA